MENRIRHERHQQHGRASRGILHSNRAGADEREDDHDGAGDRVSPRPQERIDRARRRATRGVRIVQSMTTPEKSSPACDPSAAA